MTRQAFRILQPPATHFVQVRCEDVECEAHVTGWVTVLDPALREHEQLIRLVMNSGRSYEQMRSEDAAQRTGRELPPGLTAFVFGPGQQCFDKHMEAVGRDPIFIHESRFGRRRHANGRDFNEAFNETAYRVTRAIEGSI